MTDIFKCTFCFDNTEAAVAPPIYVRGWFIALLIIIVALLCILLVLCILKSQRGGKYNGKNIIHQSKAVSETATSATATARSRASAYSSTLVDALI